MKRAAFLALAMLSPSLALADGKAIQWKQVDGWTVFMDPSMGNACYVASVYDTGVILRLGFDFSTEPRRIYMALGNKAWKSLEDGKEYPVQIFFDNLPAWNATAVGRENSDLTWLFVHTRDTNFLNDFMRKLSVRATFQGKMIAGLKLRGSSKAINEMLACQKTVNEALASRPATPPPPPTPKDPFAPAPGVRSATDPFDL